MSKENYFSRSRLQNALIGAVVSFIVVFLIFGYLQLAGFIASGLDVTLAYPLLASFVVSVVFFFAVLLITPRKYLGPLPEVEEEAKVDSVVETKVDAMEKDGEGHFHVKGERKEEDVLKRLEESHKPSEEKEPENSQQT